MTCFVCWSVCLSAGLSQKCNSPIFQHFIANDSCFSIGKLIFGKLSPNPNTYKAKVALTSNNPATHSPTNYPNEGARVQFRLENKGCLLNG